METSTQINPLNTPELDSNVEYISAKGIHDQSPIITSVFRTIFVEIPKEFYHGIKNFFSRYANLFKDGFKYLKYPSLKVDPFATKDYKENCQYTFEFLLLVIALLIFLIKLDWIYGVESLKAVYNNDISQAILQFAIFICFAISYFLLIVISVFLGRIFRSLFRIPVTRQESDILFSYLNNILFILTATAAFFVRCIVPVENIEGNETVPYVIMGIFAVGFGLMVFKWAGRLALLNNMRTSTRISFKIVVTIVIAFLYGFCSTAVTFFIWGV